jgi:hypothetical protein
MTARSLPNHPKSAQFIQASRDNRQRGRHISPLNIIACCPTGQRAMTATIGYAEVITLFLLSIGLYKYWTRDPRRAHLPPRVPGWPLINQTLLQARDNPIPYVQKWAKDYGEIFCSTSGSTLFVWISGRRAFKELIDRKSAIYSSKPPAPMATRASGGKRVTFMGYGRQWRALRNILHRVLSPGS